MNFATIVHPAYILARLPAAQKTHAVNKCVVTIHRAVEDMIHNEGAAKESEGAAKGSGGGANDNLTNQGTSHAGVTATEGKRDEELHTMLNKWRQEREHRLLDDDEIPF